MCSHYIIWDSIVESLPPVLGSWLSSLAFYFALLLYLYSSPIQECTRDRVILVFTYTMCGLKGGIVFMWAPRESLWCSKVQATLISNMLSSAIHICVYIHMRREYINELHTTAHIALTIKSPHTCRLQS